jgi:hypothetical protein
MTDVNDVLAVDTKRATVVSQVDRDRMLEAMHALEEPDAYSTHEVRDRVRWLTGSVRHHREREADLVFDALDIALEGAETSECRRDSSSA